MPLEGVALRACYFLLTGSCLGLGESCTSRQMSPVPMGLFPARMHSNGLVIIKCLLYAVIHRAAA